jgi:hypothetical protein
MYFEKNVTVLLTQNPGYQALVKHLRNIASTAETDLVLLPSKDGLECGFSYQGIWLHDPKSPTDEARRTFKASCKPMVDRAHVILGLGLGYALEYTLENSPGQIIVYESNLPLLRFALENVDLHELFANERVKLVCNPFDLLAQLRPHVYSDYDLDFLILPGSAERMKAEIPELVQKIKLMITDWARDYRTVQQFHPQWLQQFFENVPEFAQTTDMTLLANRFAGRPAIIIGRGPSLDGAIADLISLQGSAILIAVGAALHRLYAEGVTPDFAIFYDANAVEEQLHELPEHYLDKITFLLSPTTRKYAYTHPSRGKVIFLSENGAQLSAWMDQALGQRHLRLEGGGTVSLIALQAAYTMGCRDLALIGQDLAFPNNQVYAGGISVQKDGDGKLSLTPGKALYTKPHTVVTVIGQNGDLLETTESYASFIRQFEALANQLRQRSPEIHLTNCSLGGAKIDGYDLKPLSGFIGVWENWKPNLPGGLALQPSPILEADEQAKRRQNLKKALSGLQKEIADTIAFCETLRHTIPSPNVAPRLLEDGVWESTQRLFIHMRNHPFVGYLVMFELIPYKQRFVAFADAETFNPGIADDLSATLERVAHSLKTQFAVWVDQALAQWAEPLGV